MNPFYSHAVRMVGVATLLFGLIPHASLCFSQSSPDETILSSPENLRDSLVDVLDNYHQGFIVGNPELTRNSIGQHLIMVNGNFSENPAEWQAHQFLNEAEIDDWISMMLKHAGPFENKYTLSSISLRNHAAVVTTIEYGKNKFRQWEAQQTSYWLGNIEGIWKIVGIYIQDLKNPD